MLGAGPLVFRCVEPFRVWTASFDGTAVETSTDALIAGHSEGSTVDVSFTVEATMAAPPWVQGTLFPEAAEMLAHSIEGKFMGGPRHEQLFRAEATFRAGDEQHTFTGSGLRIRRQGIRDIGEFWGHAWQSALFPSGRGFGYIAYPPRPDGSESYNEGYLFMGDGALVPAKVKQAPWLTAVRSNGDDASVVLESELGLTHIEGETIVSTYELGIPEIPQFPVLFQGGARYRWDGEETYGMLERSSTRAKLGSDEPPGCRASNIRAIVHDINSGGPRRQALGGLLMGLLDGKVAVITGAGSGMAHASVEVFVREGARSSRPTSAARKRTRLIRWVPACCRSIAT